LGAAPVPGEPVDLSEILKSRLWRHLRNFTLHTFQATMFQPVGGMDMIVKAFAAGDRPTLRNLLAPNVMASFDSAIARRETEGRTESVEFLHPPRADLEKAEMSGAGDLARLTVRFLAEFRNRSKGPEGEAVDDRRTAELWTFERNLKSRDPNWMLIHVDAAEA